MRYSDVVLTDNNFDKELEKLCDFVGISLNSYNSFIDRIKDFKLQYTDGKEEWINVLGNFPNKSSDSKQTYQKGQLAYEFGNGFIILNYNVLL